MHAPWIAAIVGNGSAAILEKTRCPVRASPVAVSSSSTLANSPTSAPTMNESFFPLRITSATSDGSAAMSSSVWSSSPSVAGESVLTLESG